MKKSVTIYLNELNALDTINVFTANSVPTDPTSQYRNFIHESHHAIEIIFIPGDPTVVKFNVFVLNSDAVKTNCRLKRKLK